MTKKPNVSQPEVDQTEKGPPPPEQKPKNSIPESLNRSAFLLGVYVAIPASDCALKPLVQLSHMLPMTKVLLLDSALVRLGEYDSEIVHFPQPGSSVLNAVDVWRLDAVKSSYHRALDRVRTIADLMLGLQPELGAWYQAGKAVGVLADTFDYSGGLCAIWPDEVEAARTYLKLAASYWNAGVKPENGSELIDWLSQFDCDLKVAAPTKRESKRKAVEPDVIKEQPPAPKTQLQIVEGLAEQIRDRVYDVRTKQQLLRDEEQQLRDERDRFIYEQFQLGCDANQVRELTNKKIDQDKLKWPMVPAKTEVRAIAEQYVLNFHMPRLPPGKVGRPPRKTRK